MNSFPGKQCKKVPNKIRKFCSFLFWDRILLNSSGLPQTHPPASASQACPTTQFIPLIHFIKTVVLLSLQFSSWFQDVQDRQVHSKGLSKNVCEYVGFLCSTCSASVAPLSYNPSFRVHSVLKYLLGLMSKIDWVLWLDLIRLNCRLLSTYFLS